MFRPASLYSTTQSGHSPELRATPRREQHNASTHSDASRHLELLNSYHDPLFSPGGSATRNSAVFAGISSASDRLHSLNSLLSATVHHMQACPLSTTVLAGVAQQIRVAAAEAADTAAHSLTNEAAVAALTDQLARERKRRLAAERNAAAAAAARTSGVGSDDPYYHRTSSPPPPSRGLGALSASAHGG